MRSALAVIGGFVLWSVLWLASNQSVVTALPRYVKDDGGIDHPAILLMMLSVSVVLSVVAGYLAATLARRAEVGHALALGALLLVAGIFAQVQYWEVIPLWYHLCFLGLLVPGSVLGGWIRDLHSPAVQPA